MGKKLDTVSKKQYIRSKTEKWKGGEITELKLSVALIRGYCSTVTFAQSAWVVG